VLGSAEIACWMLGWILNYKTVKKKNMEDRYVKKYDYFKL
jgi:hypothetical protein